MATYSSDRVTSGIPVRFNEKGSDGEVGTYSASAAISATDVFQMVRVPAGAMITDIILQIPGLSSPSYSLGDGVNTSRFTTTASSSFATLGQGLGYSYSVADTIDVRFDAAATTATGKFVMAASWKVDQAS